MRTMARQRSSVSGDKASGTGLRQIDRLLFPQAGFQSSALPLKYCRRMVWRKPGSSQLSGKQLFRQPVVDGQRYSGEARETIAIRLALELLIACGMIWRSEKRRLPGMKFQRLMAAAISCFRSGTPGASASDNPVNRPKRWYELAVDQPYNCVTVVAPFSNIPTSKRKN